MKNLFSNYRTGIFVAIPIFIIIVLVMWAWNNLLAISFDNIWLALGILFLGPFLIGWLVSMRWFRNAVLKLFEPIPIISSLSNFLFNHEYIERLQSDELNLMPEVMFRLDNSDNWTIGIVVGKQKLPQNPLDKNSLLANWLVILAPPTPPLAFTAQLRLVKESDVCFTGRHGQDTALTVAAFGLNLDLDPKKFKIPKDKQDS